MACVGQVELMRSELVAARELNAEAEALIEKMREEEVSLLEQIAALKAEVASLKPQFHIGERVDVVWSRGPILNCYVEEFVKGYVVRGAQGIIPEKSLALSKNRQKGNPVFATRPVGPDADLVRALGDFGVFRIPKVPERDSGLRGVVLDVANALAKIDFDDENVGRAALAFNVGELAGRLCVAIGS